MPRQRKRLRPSENDRVSAEQRFVAGSPCPICGGHKDLPQGSGERCWGFESKDGHGAICTREESPHEAKSGDHIGWFHPLDSSPAQEANASVSDNDIENVYRYDDEDGVPSFEVVRFSGKRFKQRRVGASTWGINGVRRFPYRLPQIIEAANRGERVYVVEGEKDVHAIENAGAVATCNPGGAGKWEAAYAEYLRSAEVLIVADKDDVGRAHAAQVRRSLVGITAPVTIVEAREGKDAADHLSAGGTLDNLVLVRPRFERFDLVEYEPRPAEWLVKPVLLRRSYTLVTAKAGVGKTWIGLSLLTNLIGTGNPVAYFDQENGPDVMLTRLRALGVERDTLHHLHYFPYPSPQEEELEEFIADVSHANPVLAVFDSKANFLAAADLDEDSSGDLTRWHAVVVQPLQAIGCAVLDLDHSGHKDATRARGSSAKEAVAEASWTMEIDRAFDKDSTSIVTLKRGMKNRRGELPPGVHYSMGGDGNGGFVFKETEAAAPDDKRAARMTWQRQEIRRAVISHWKEHNEALSLTALTKIVTGAASEVRESAKDLGNTPGSGIEILAGPRGAVLLKPTENTS